MNEEKIYYYKETISPDKLIYDSNFYNIEITDFNYIINGFHIYTKKNKIQNIKLNCSHPNCNPKTKEFCIPDFIKDLEVTKESIQIIINMLKLFNFDNSYYQPWIAFKYIRK